MQDFTKLWERALDSLTGEVSSAAMSLWFRELDPVLLTDTAAVLLARSEFKRGIVETTYKSIIEKAICGALGRRVEIVILAGTRDTVDLSPYVPYDANAASDDAEDGVEGDVEVEGDEPDYYATRDVTAADRYRPRKEYTFDNFLVGSSNKFAHAAALAVANGYSASIREYNPLFIYGGAGLGKTHLLYAITNRVLEQDPDAKIVYAKGNEFTNQMVASISANKTAEFRDKFRTADILLIDDIQFIAGREGTQEEFFHTFDALYEADKQIVLTSDRPPHEIQRLTDRLLSRFEWGAIADIQPPNYELRRAIIRSKAENLGYDTPDDVLEFLAENLTDNVRQLEGALKRVMAHSYLTGEAVTVDNARRWVSDMVSGVPQTEVTVDRIISVVAQRYGVSQSDILGRKKTAEIAEARHKAVYLVKALTGMSNKSIGREVFNRDHTTIYNSLNNVEFEMKNDAAYEQEIKDLIDEIVGRKR